ncbi:MAG: hypothetical protein K0S80_4705 [Neobacillus sp.]|nr:hypothetical protein [Neobacillus sp.]
MGKFEDLTGKKFNRLTIDKFIEMNKFGKSTWLCKCDCGKEVVCVGSQIKTGYIKSCGCYQKEMVIKRNKDNAYIKDYRLYYIWENMRQRCFNQKNENYSDWGGRGITVCKEWDDKFIVFYEWSIVNGYKEKLTIDRIDVNGDYEPSNCRWATQKQQSNNKRNNRFITYKDKTKTLAEWADISDISIQTLHYRIKNNWSIGSALTTPIRGCKNK